VRRRWRRWFRVRNVWRWCRRWRRPRGAHWSETALTARRGPDKTVVLAGGCSAMAATAGRAPMAPMVATAGPAGRRACGVPAATAGPAGTRPRRAVAGAMAVPAALTARPAAAMEVPAGPGVPAVPGRPPLTVVSAVMAGPVARTGSCCRSTVPAGLAARVVRAVPVPRGWRNRRPGSPALLVVMAGPVALAGPVGSTTERLVVPVGPAAWAVTAVRVVPAATVAQVWAPRWPVGLAGRAATVVARVPAGPVARPTGSWAVPALLVMQVPVV
jgi:hypothetical protein